MNIDLYKKSNKKIYTQTEIDGFFFSSKWIGNRLFDRTSYNDIYVNSEEFIKQEFGYIEDVKLKAIILKELELLRSKVYIACRMNNFTLVNRVTHSEYKTYFECMLADLLSNYKHEAYAIFRRIALICEVDTYMESINEKIMDIFHELIVDDFGCRHDAFSEFHLSIPKYSTYNEYIQYAVEHRKNKEDYGATIFKFELNFRNKQGLLFELSDPTTIIKLNRYTSKSSMYLYDEQSFLEITRSIFKAEIDKFINYNDELKKIIYEPI